MIADFAVHAPDKDVPNPHFHVLCPIRPVLENGQWGEKQKREYVLDEQGNRVRDESGAYVFKSIPTTDWGQKETLAHWREEWANYVNRAFEEKGLSCRIDHRSNAERGMDELPTVHEGPAVRAMEAKGIITEKGELNRIIRRLNFSLREIRKKLRSVLDWISEIKEKMQEPQQPGLGQLVALYLSKRNAGAWSSAGKLSNLKKTSDIVNYLTENNISTVEELHERADEAYRTASDLNAQVKDVKAHIKAIDEQIQLSQYLTEYKPIIDKLNSFHFKGRREKYKQEHEKEISFYYMAARKLKEHLDKELSFPASKLAAWKKQRTKLAQQVSELSTQHSAIYAEQKKLLNIQRIVDNTLHEWEREHGIVRHKDRTTER